MVVFFEYLYKGETARVVGKFDPQTREITLPSGYVLPVFDNGYVHYNKQTVRVYYLSDGRPVEIGE